MDPHLASTDPYSLLSLDKTKQQIRLLQVARRSPGPVECILDVFDLDTAPSYTALSYRWGSPVAEHTIFINGHSSRVSDNLFYFLETWRHEDGYDEYLWIDQICIKQLDTEERNHQVGLMSEIYFRCRRTIVYVDGVLAVKPCEADTRDKCAKHLSKVLGFPNSKSEYLIALLDLVWPMHNAGTSVPFPRLLAHDTSWVRPDFFNRPSLCGSPLVSSPQGFEKQHRRRRVCSFSVVSWCNPRSVRRVMAR